MSFRKEVLAEGVTIYGLCQPIDRWRTGEVRYVGKTIGTPWHRVRAHIYAAKRGGSLPVHRFLRKYGEPYHIKHLEWVPAGEDWAARERFWIKKFRDDGVRLLNITEGGDGLSGLQFSDDHKQKIRDALRQGAYFDCEQCGDAFWRKPHEIRNGFNKFCSRGCYQISQRGKAKPVSAVCIERGVAAAAARRKARTHCKRLHPLSGDNLFITSSGSRGCKECRKIHKRTYRSKAR